MEGRGGCHRQTFPDYPLLRSSAPLAKNQASLPEKGAREAGNLWVGKNLLGIVAIVEQRESVTYNLRGLQAPGKRPLLAVFTFPAWVG